MSGKWTPGPWMAFFESDQCGATPRDRSKGDVAHCAGLDSARRTDEADANAHLIAAAPDLYAALDALIDGQNWVMSTEKFLAAKAALAKARGETK